MAHALSSRSDLIEHLAHDLPTVSATQLVAGMQKVARAVMNHGAVLITKHDEPAMVLLSVDRYLELEQAAEPDLDTLTRQFDDMYTRMQAPHAAQRMADAFAMSETELGAAAVKAAGGKRTAK